jgi:hypothetical protein
VWWPTVKLKRSKAELSNLQKLACLGIAKAMTIILTAAIEVLLGLPPLHLLLGAEAKSEVYRLNCNHQWKPKSEGFRHTYMTQKMKKEPIIRMGNVK